MKSSEHHMTSVQRLHEVRSYTSSLPHCKWHSTQIKQYFQASPFEKCNYSTCKLLMLETWNSCSWQHLWCSLDQSKVEPLETQEVSPSVKACFETWTPDRRTFQTRSAQVTDLQKYNKNIFPLTWTSTHEPTICRTHKSAFSAKYTRASSRNSSGKLRRFENSRRSFHGSFGGRTP